MPETLGSSPPAARRPRRLLHDALIDVGRDPVLRGRNALVIEGRPYTYGQLLDASLRLAAALGSRGVQRGDRVAIYLDNSWPCVISIYAVLITGAVTVLINPQTKEEKLEFILRDSGARALITDSRLSQVFLPALPRLSPRPAVICSGAPIGVDGIDSFEYAAAEGRSLASPIPLIPLDLAAIIYTSGSTGHPKGVMQTHQSMLFAAGSIIEYLRLTAEDRILCVLPLSFDYGLYQLLMAVELGACLVLARSFTYPAEAYALIRDEQITVLPGVPTIFATLIGAHQRTSLCFPSVTRVTNTAAALPDEFLGSLREIFPNALIYKMYGLTECKRVSYLEPELLNAKPGSVGRAIPGTEVYLRSESGEPLASGEVGILYVRGPHVMVGYWNRPDITDRMLKPGKLPGERVLCTHDLFKMDDEGFLYFVARTDDIIKTRGEKVSPIEVEQALHRLPGVREVAVIAMPDPLLGQALVACIVADSGTELDPQDIRARSADFLESHMIPKRVIFYDQLPRAENGKIDKHLLLKRLRNEI